MPDEQTKPLTPEFSEVTIDAEFLEVTIDNAIDNYEAQKAHFQVTSANALIGVYRAEGAINAMNGLKEFLFPTPKEEVEIHIASEGDGT